MRRPSATPLQRSVRSYKAPQPDYNGSVCAYRSDKQPLRFVDPEILANAFLHTETRKVDKSGCINFMNKKYEVGLSFIGRKVDVVYDPKDISELTIEYEGYTPWKAKELQISEHVGKRQALPSSLQVQAAQSSRLLTAAEKMKEQRLAQQIPAISFRTVSKEEKNHHV